MSGNAFQRPGMGTIMARSIALAQAGTSAEGETVHRLSLSLLSPNPDQPRRYFSPSKLQELAESVRRQGVLQPLLARPMENGTYQIIFGERRYRAAKLAGLSDVPVIVRTLSDDEAEIIASAENLQRENLNRFDEVWNKLIITSKLLGYPDVRFDPLQQVDAIAKLRELRRKPESEPELVAQIETLFAQLGREKWVSFVANGLPVLNLPQALVEALREGRLDYTKALLISRSSQHGQERLLQRALGEDLSLEALRTIVRQNQAARSTPQDELRSLLSSKRLNALEGKKRDSLDRLIGEIRQLLAQEDLDEKIERDGMKLATPQRGLRYASDQEKQIGLTE